MSAFGQMSLQRSSTRRTERAKSLRNGGRSVVSLREASAAGGRLERSRYQTGTSRGQFADVLNPSTTFLSPCCWFLAAPPLSLRSDSPACRGALRRLLLACHHAGCSNDVRSLDAEGAFTFDKSRPALQPNPRQAGCFHLHARISSGECDPANTLEKPTRLPEPSRSRGRGPRKGWAGFGTATSTCLAAQRKRRLFRPEGSRQVFTE